MKKVTEIQTVLRLAESRLKSSNYAYERMLKSDNDLVEYEIHWVDFLSASNSFFEKFEKAAGKFQAFGEFYSPFRKERKKDSLLQYLHQARNSEEHCVGESGEPIPKAKGLIFNASITVAKNKVELEKLKLEQAEMAKRVENVPKNRFRAIPVVNYGREYGVPLEHLKKSSFAIHPNEMAFLALSYMSNTLEAAKQHFS